MCELLLIGVLFTVLYSKTEPLSDYLVVFIFRDIYYVCPQQFLKTLPQIIGGEYINLQSKTKIKSPRTIDISRFLGLLQLLFNKQFN
jgi:hypothetical protein